MRISPSRIGIVCCLGLAVTGCAVQPVEVTPEETAIRVVANRAELFGRQEPLPAKVGLWTATARAVLYNIQRRTEMMKEALAAGQSDMAAFDMLPSVAARAGYSMRRPDSSGDNPRRTGDLTATWNLLDFGMGWFSAKQGADGILVAKERRRKVVNNLIQDVRGAFARAAVAEMYGEEVDRVAKEAARTLADIRSAGEASLLAPVTVMSFEKEILDSLRDIEDIRDRMATARIELAGLMNADPNAVFSIDMGDLKALRSLDWPANLDVRTMEDMALARNPDILGAIYQERISAEEVHKAMLRMVPVLDFSLGRTFDSSSTVAASAWNQAGIGAAWNLIKLVRGPGEIRNAENAREITRLERLGLSMAVLTQLHVGLRDLDRIERRMMRTSEIADVEKRLGRTIAARFAASAESRLGALRASVNGLKASIEKEEMEAELENARSRLAVTMGFDPLPEKIGALDQATLAEAIRKRVFDWMQGVE